MTLFEKKVAFIVAASFVDHALETITLKTGRATANTFILFRSDQCFKSKKLEKKRSKFSVNFSDNVLINSISKHKSNVRP